MSVVTVRDALIVSCSTKDRFSETVSFFQKLILKLFGINISSLVKLSAD